MLVAALQEVWQVLGPAHIVQELAFGIHGEADEVQEFLETAGLLVGGLGGVAAFVGELLNIRPHVGERGHKRRQALLDLAPLAENPRVPDGMAAHHHAVRLGLGRKALGLGGGGDIAVGDDGAGDGRHGLGDGGVIDFGPVEAFDGTAVHGEEVDLMLRDDGEDLVEALLVVEADAHLDGEEAGDLLAHRADEFVDLGRIAQQAAADVLTIHLGRRAAHVEVDAGDGQLTQLTDGAEHVRGIFTDELCEDRPAGAVIDDGVDDVLLGRRTLMDAEIFGDEPVGRAATADDAHEAGRGHVLHRREHRRARAGDDGDWQGPAHACLRRRASISAMSSQTSRTDLAMNTGRLAFTASTRASLGRASTSAILRATGPS